jgi:hypothetical protein
MDLLGITLTGTIVGEPETNADLLGINRTTFTILCPLGIDEGPKSVLVGVTASGALGANLAKCAGSGTRVILTGTLALSRIGSGGRVVDYHLLLTARSGGVDMAWPTMSVAARPARAWPQEARSIAGRLAIWLIRRNVMERIEALSQLLSG